MKFSLNLFLILFLGTSISYGQNFTEFKTRSIDQSFTVTSDVAVEIDTEYGNIEIKTGNKNQFKVNAEIKVGGKNKEAVNEVFDKINVDIDVNEERDRVSIDSYFGMDENFNTNKNISVQINFTIYIPKNASLEIDHEYGDIFLNGSLYGTTEIDLSYGNFTAEELKGESAYLDFEHVSEAKIKYLKYAEIDAEYSKFFIEEAGNIEIDSDYTDLTLGKARTVIIESDYGNFDISEAHSVEFDADYSHLKIKKLTGSLKVDADYGTVNVDRIERGFTSIELDSDHTNYDLGVASAAGYQLEAEVENGSIEFPKNFRLSKRDSDESEYSGKTGDGSGFIEINTEYGNINIREVR